MAIDRPPTVIMTVKEVAAYLRVHPVTVYKLLRKGEVPAFRIGSDWRFNKEKIDQWMASLTPSARIQKSKSGHQMNQPS